MSVVACILYLIASATTFFLKPRRSTQPPAMEMTTVAAAGPLKRQTITTVQEADGTLTQTVASVPVTTDGAEKGFVEATAYAVP